MIPLTIGVNRLVYQADNFIEHLDVSIILWHPSLRKYGPFSMNELSEGIYYLDYDFPSIGPYIGLVAENGNKITSITYRVEKHIKSLSFALNQMHIANRGKNPHFVE